jgi:aminomethyltransferase
MVDFGGYEMPVNYPDGILSEHLGTRKNAGLFDISHMGRFIVGGAEAVGFLQHVLSNNVCALEVLEAQYTMIPDADGGALDDAYLYRFYEEEYLLVVNAANAEKDWAHLTAVIKDFDATITDRTQEIGMISLQGPRSKEILLSLSAGDFLTEPLKNALNIITLDGKETLIAKTGYTGEPIGYELFLPSDQTPALWRKLIECGAQPVGLGARDTLRLEAGLPLYGHELGADIDGNQIPIYAVPLAKFAVSFAAIKGDYIGRAALKKQFEAFERIFTRHFAEDISALPYVVKPYAFVGKGMPRYGCRIYKDGADIGYVTSGTVAPFYEVEGAGLASAMTDDTNRRFIGLALVKSTTIEDDEIEIDIRGKREKAVIVEYHLRGDAPPYARTISYGVELPKEADDGFDYVQKARNLMVKSLGNHEWRQQECINLIPSEQSQSRAVRILTTADPSSRYAEHKKAKPFYDQEIFYYQGTDFIDGVERLLAEELKKYFGCKEIEARATSGQMANTAVYSALMDFKNRADRKRDPARLGYVLNNHIIRGGHLSAQPMGALHDYIAIDPVTERHALVNFPVLPGDLFRIDTEETAKIIDRYRPELIILGKSMVLYREPVAAVRKIVSDIGLETVIMYDMAHVLGLTGAHFQDPFAEGADIVTGSTHKTFFGPQRGVVAANYDEADERYKLWEMIENRIFPGSVSNHHLGTLLGLLMAAYEMNEFKEDYQKNVIENAKYFARCLADEGLDVAGDPEVSYTETHQVIVRVGYGTGPEVARRLEENNIVCNYQATPDEEGFTASGALRLGVSEMTRFGFGREAFAETAKLLAQAVSGGDVKASVKKLRSGYTEMKYCFADEEMNSALERLAAAL